MFSKTVKTTNGNLKVTIPSSRDEISIGLLQRLTPEPGHSFGFMEQISILSGVPMETDDEDKACLLDVINQDELVSGFEAPLQALAYQLKAFQEVQAIPDEIMLIMPHNYPASGKFKRWFNSDVKGKVIPVIKNLGVEPAGAYMEAKEVIKQEYERWERVKKEYGDHIEFNPSIESQIKVLSIYFYCRATGEKFKSHKIDEFSEVIKKLSITQALPIARYFFLSYPNLSRPKVTPSVESLKQLISGRVLKS